MEEFRVMTQDVSQWVLLFCTKLMMHACMEDTDVHFLAWYCAWKACQTKLSVTACLRLDRSKWAVCVIWLGCLCCGRCEDEGFRYHFDVSSHFKGTSKKWLQLFPLLFFYSSFQLVASVKAVFFRLDSLVFWSSVKYKSVNYATTFSKKKIRPPKILLIGYPQMSYVVLLHCPFLFYFFLLFCFTFLFFFTFETYLCCNNLGSGSVFLACMHNNKNTLHSVLV